MVRRIWGGPTSPIVLHGASQGGIMTSLSAAVQRDIEAAVVMVPGGGWRIWLVAPTSARCPTRWWGAPCLRCSSGIRSLRVGS